MNLRVFVRRRAYRWWYRNVYLQSRHWKAFRAGWWQRHPWARCAVCHCGHPLDLNHLTYVRLWHELDTDVQPLCRYDHRQYHGH